MTEQNKLTVKGRVNLYGYVQINADIVEILGHLVIEPYTLVVISGITKEPLLDVSRGQLTLQATGKKESTCKLLVGARWWSPRVLWARFRMWRVRQASEYVPVHSGPDAEILIS